MALREPQHRADDSRLPRASRWRSWMVQLGVVAGCAVLLYLALAFWTDFERVGQSLRSFPPRAVLPVLALVIVGLFLRGLRWLYYTRQLRLDLPSGPSFLAFLASFAFTATPGKVGEVVKSLLLRRRFGSRISKTAGVLVVERVTDLLAVLLLACLGLSTVADRGWVIAASSLLLVGAMAFLLSERIHAPALAAVTRLPGLGRFAVSLPELVGSSRQLLGPAGLGVGLGLAVLAWSCEAVALWIVLSALGAEVAWTGAFLAFGLSTLLGVLSMLPGGIGGFEASMVFIFQQLAVASTTAVAATLIFRLATLWGMSLLGLFFLGVWMAIFGLGEEEK